MWSHGESVKHLRFAAATRNALGNARDGWEAPRTIENVAVAQQSTGEPGNPADTKVINLTQLYFNSPITIDARDRFEVRGVTYSVDGESLAPVNPFTGWAPGAVVTLTAVSGG